jgi:hypothetical protein
MKYKVRFCMDNTYCVIEIETDEHVFSGSLADCEAYIRLKENGYL